MQFNPRRIKWEVIGFIRQILFDLGVPMSSPPHRTKRRVIKRVAKEFSLGVFCETGTYQGDMTAAMVPHFDTLYSIELSQELYQNAKLRFRNAPTVTLYQGDSGEVIHHLLDQITRPCLFWLDAHYSGGVTARGASDTPIERELNFILSHSSSDHVILIDDARCFDGSNGYPTIEALKAQVAKLNPRYCVSVGEDIIQIIPQAQDSAVLSARESNSSYS